MLAFLTRHAEVWLALGVLAAAVVVADRAPPMLTALREAVFDTYQRWQPRDYAPSPVRIVDIDDETLSRVGQWQWPRTRVAELVAKLRDLGAAVIVFDILFAEPDRTSPQQVLPLWGGGDDEIAALANRLADHDQVLAETMRGTKVVTAAAFGDELPRTSAPPRKYGFAHAGDDPLPFLERFNGVTANLPVIDDAAHGMGAINFLGSAGILRKVPLLLRYRDETEPYPALSLEALRVAQEASTYIVSSTGASRTTRLIDQWGINQVRVGALTVPTDPTGQFRVHYTKHVSERFIPAWRVLDGSVTREAVEGMIILIGSSAAGLKDQRATPVEPVVAGVTVHAQMIEQMIHQAWLQRRAWAGSAEIAFLIVLGLAVIILSARLGPAWTAVTGGTGLVVAAGFSWYAYSEWRLLFDPVYPSLSVIAVYLVASLVGYLKTERQRKFVENTFSTLISPNLVQFFIDNPAQVRLGGERRDCSFVLTDLAGFTSLVERSDPAELVKVLNEYLEQMTRIAFEHDGTLDSVVGDAVAVMFSAPRVQSDHAERAVACALAMDTYAQDFAERKRAEGIPLGDTRIGVNTGPVVVGNIGGEQHSDYRALGDPINTASRLETVNKHLGTRICVSGTTVAQCPDFVGRPVGTLVLKGKSEGVEAFEPLTQEESRSPGVTAYLDAFARLDTEPDGALPAFAALKDAYPDDPLVRFHLDRLEKGEAGRVVVMTEK